MHSRFVSRSLLILAAALVLSCHVSAATANFDSDRPGTPPAPWKVGVAGTGAGIWEIIAAQDAPSKPNVLRQSGVATRTWCVKSDERIRDGFVEVQGKTISGIRNRAIGVVFRFQDPKNYYMARASANERNVALHKVVDGSRKTVAHSSDDLLIPDGVWHTLRVEFSGTKSSVLLNGHVIFRVWDETFLAAGGVGLVTSSDSVTLFDNFVFGAL